MRLLLSALMLFATCSCSPASSSRNDVTGPTPTTDTAGELPSSADALAMDAGQADTREEKVLLFTIGHAVPLDLDLPGTTTSLALLDGKLPAGVFVTGEGLAWGRPTRAEITSATLAVTRGEAKPQTETWQFEVSNGEFAILPLEAVVGAVATPFNSPLQTNSAPEGTSPTWALARGSLPAGLALDPDGSISGTPTQEGLFPLLLVAEAKTQTARLATMIRIGDAPVLRTMADEFEAAALDHLIPNGMLLSSWPDGHFGDHGDSGMWTGTFLAAAALKSALTGETETVDHVTGGLTTCRLVTGVPGLTARGIERNEWQGRTENPNISLDHPEGHQSTTPGYEDFRWTGDVSRDQWTGHFLGNTLAWLLASSETSAKAAANMVAMAMHLHQNDMEIHDVDGEVTKYGHISGYAMDGGFPMPNGVNAIMSLAWFQAAALAATSGDSADILKSVVDQMLSPPPPGWSYLEDDGEWGYIEAMEDLLYPYLGGHADRKWFNMNITNDAFFNALLILPDGPQRDRIINIWWDEMWTDHGDTPITRRAQSEQNPWFTFMFLSATCRTDADAHFEALQQMIRFPPPPRLAVAISNSDNPTFPHDPEWNGWAAAPLPTEERCSGTNFVWQRNPYELDCMGSVGQEYAGTDFLAPYWLGVAMGYIDPRM